MKKTLVGTVASAKREKTLRVEIERRFQHQKYGKIVRARTVCHVHDEDEVASEGDLVEICESRPMSKTKRWSLVKVVKAAQVVGVGSSEDGDTESAEG